MLGNVSFIFMWLCITIIAVSFFGSVLYYNLEKPSFNEMVVELVEEYDINPIVLECMNKDWGRVSNFEICRLAVQNPKMSEEEMNQLIGENE